LGAVEQLVSDQVHPPYSMIALTAAQDRQRQASRAIASAAIRVRTGAVSADRRRERYIGSAPLPDAFS
jgi:hypothetical protein